MNEMSKHDPWQKWPWWQKVGYAFCIVWTAAFGIFTIGAFFALLGGIR